MPTVRGWFVAGTGALGIVAGRLLGSPQVERLGVALVALVVLAIVVVRRNRGDLEVRRSIVPKRAPAGSSLTVTLEVVNRGRSPLALVLVEDRLPRGISGRARFVLQGIEPGGDRVVSFDIAAVRRGRFEVGPVTASFLDPFGMARVQARPAGTETFFSRPRVEPLTLPRDGGDRRSATSAAFRSPVGATGEDFYTLREYIEGDDLRKVHWPSTARRGKFTIRQEETPWQTRATIVLDDRLQSHTGPSDGSSFERAVEVAASLADLYHRAGYSWRVAGVADPGLPMRRGADHLNRCLDWLTVVEATPYAADDALQLRLRELEGGVGENALVVITGMFDPATTSEMVRLRRRYRDVVAVSLPAHLYGHHSTKARWAGEKETVETSLMLTRSGGRFIVLGPGDGLGLRWSPSRMTPVTTGVPKAVG